MGQGLMHGFISIVDILQRHANTHPNHIAIKFLTQKGYDILTYSELDQQAKCMAQVLRYQYTATISKRAIILLPPGINYIVAFLGCLYAGVIPVPVYPPRKNQHANRVFAIIDDAQANYIITHELLVKQFNNYQIINMDTLFLDHQLTQEYNPITIDPNQPAFLQYTSGSTHAPKGVKITHKNIMSNLQFIQSLHPGGEKYKVFSWLPPYHDMGLIGGILCPLYTRTELILMSPAYFLHYPYRWLEIITQEKVTMTVAPNFAFDLCVRKIHSSQINQLNLSSLRCVFNGAEPILHSSMQRFINTFARVGFSPRTFYACYGLAEATLMLTVKQYDTINYALTLYRPDFVLKKVTIVSSLEPENTQDDSNKINIINCGANQADHIIKIVDPDNLQVLPEHTIGEIWASGPSIAEGYWNNPAATNIVFNNQLQDTPGIKYLRTNDLGFMHAGNLFITGRLNDLIIIDGKNYYPHDIEQLSMQSHTAFEFQSAAAFTIETDSRMELVLLQEVRREALRNLESETLFAKLRATLLDYGLLPLAIVLVKPYSLPKTSSGKIQRLAAKKSFEEKTLQQLACWKQSKQSNNITQPYLSLDFPLDATKQWLANWFLQHLHMPLTRVDYNKTITQLGINSVTAAELSTALQQKLGKPFELFTLFEQCSLNQLIAILAYQQSYKNMQKIHPQQDIDLANTIEVNLVTDAHTKVVINNIDLPANHVIANLKNIYFNVNDGISSNITTIANQQYINYSGYNYLGLSGDPIVTAAVIEAVKQFGTSVSASRLVSGEKPVHADLEKAIANLIGVEECLVFPSGYFTNVSILTHLFKPGDVIIYDALAHNSIIQGALFSGAKCIPFPHNNYAILTNFLQKYREQYKKALIVTEGIFSMDGDIPDIKRLITIKQQFNAHLMIDEAHSIGVLGKTGGGIREFYDLNPEDIDIWMGTLSKAFASCGGYIAGSHKLIENFKYTAAGFVYSAGISPANAAAALAAIGVMQQEPHRIRILQQRQHMLANLLQQRGISTGLSSNTPIIPIMVKEDVIALQLSQYLKEHHILALPIIYPAVEKGTARVRLFVNCLHTEEQIFITANVLAQSHLLPKYKILEIS